MKRLILFVLPLLVACGEGSAVEREFMKAYRDNSIKACVVTARTTSNGRASDELLTRVCSCMTDRTMQGRTMADLAQMVPGGPETQAAVAQCVREIAPGALGGAAATADAAAASAVAKASGAVSGALDRAGGAAVEPAAG